MNTTKFRGKSLSTGEWVYGNLIQTPTKTYILETEHEVEFIEPEYHEQGMGCGLEDRNITDRYEAMFHGFERALDKCAENHPPFIEVDPNTVGQYIRDNDKDGKEIYEGDIVRGYFASLDFEGNEHGKVETVIVDDIAYAREYLEDVQQRTLEIIGNIHDNPTLLTQ